MKNICFFTHFSLDISPLDSKFDSLNNLLNQVMTQIPTLYHRTDFVKRFSLSFSVEIYRIDPEGDRKEKNRVGNQSDL